MKFAIPLSILPMDEIKPLGIAADEIGYDFLAVSDHLIHPETFSVPYPYTDDGSVRWEQGTDWPDPVSTLSFLAGATKLDATATSKSSACTVWQQMKRNNSKG